MSTTPNAPTAGCLELRHVEHLMDVCGDSHDGLMLLGTMAVVANVITQRDEAESALLAARRENEALRDALDAIAGLRPYRDPAYPHINIYELPEIARAALAATQEER